MGALRGRNIGGLDDDTRRRPLKLSTLDTEGAARIAALAAGLMIAQQVAGKATRDALFLLNFPVTYRPALLATGALISVLVVMGASRLLGARGPGRVVPAGFALSAVLFLTEWALSGIAPKAVAILVYLHVAALGAALISGFWSLFNERFEPRTAKRRVGTIGAAAALGGVLGGLVAERVGSQLSVPAMLPFLAVMHLGCAGLIQLLAGPPSALRASSHRERDVPVVGVPSPVHALARNPFLRHLAAVVALAAICAGLLDYVFQARVQATFGQGPQLIRVFAFFYTGISILTFLAQSLLARVSLRKLQVAPTLAMLPLGVIVGSSAALAFPSLVAAGIAWSLEAVLHSSLARSAYEVLFVPVPEREKRAAKPMIDVGFDRLGDAVSAGIVSLTLLLAGPLGAPPILLGGALVVALVFAWFARRLQSGYERTLANSIVSQSESPLPTNEDLLTVSNVIEIAQRERDSRSMAHPVREVVHRPAPAQGRPDETVLLTQVVRKVPAGEPSPSPPPSPATPSGRVSRSSTPPAARTPDPVSTPAREDPSTMAQIFRRPDFAATADPLVEKIADLRSRDPARARRVLASNEPLAPALAALAIPLVGVDGLATDAMLALRRSLGRVTGLIVDALLDREQAFDVRRRLPRVLSAVPSARAIEGLLHGLEDKRFEVRYECGRSLDRIHTKAPELAIDAKWVLEAVLHEVTVDRLVWESQQALEDHDAVGETEDRDTALGLDDFLRRRSNRSLEHVFTLLTLVHPQKPLRLAFLGLQTDDLRLRGTALEYLETALPPDIRDKLWPFLTDERPRRQAGRSKEKVLDELIRSNDSIIIHIDELRKRQQAS